MLSPTKFLWDMSVNSQTGEVCEFPVSMIHFARPPADKGERTVTLGTPDKQKALEITYKVQCAECQRERRRRRMVARALEATTSSFASGARVWKGTLTCSAEYLYKAKCTAIIDQQVRSSGINFCGPQSDLSARAFRLLDAVIYRDIQKFLKRLRKAGHRFTFLCVTERTPKSRKDGAININAGMPHYHLLLHEASAAGPVSKRDLQDGEWPGGFVKFKLVNPEDPTDALYACKYLNKEGGRVRASKHYGNKKAMDRASQPCIEDGTSSVVTSKV